MIAPTPTLMRREIGQVPDAVARVVAAPEETDAAADAVRRAAPRFVMIAARGTSDHAAVYAQYLIETQIGLPTGLTKPSVTTLYGARLAWDGGLLLAISQSGRSPDIVAVTEAARAGGALAVAVTNDDRSPLAAAADHVLRCHAGPERAVPATKTYITALAAIAALVGALEPASGLPRALAALPELLQRTELATEAWLGAAGGATVARLAAADRALVVSRGYNLATALELALKLKETSALFAEPYSTADFAHGPLILAGPGVPALLIRPDGPMAADVDGAADRIRSRGGATTVLGGAEMGDRSDALALPGHVQEPLSPLAFAVAGQLIVEAVSRRRGLDPDAPPGLGKVTLTR